MTTRLTTGLLVSAMAAADLHAQPANPAAAAPTIPAPEQAADLLGAVRLTADQMALIRRTLSQADAQGLDPTQFISPDIDGLPQSRRPDGRDNGQVELINGVLRYAMALHAGRLPAGDFLYEWGLRPAAYDPTQDFVQAAAADRLAAWLDSLPPPYPGYEALRTALGVYRRIEANGGWGFIADGPALKLGVSDPRVKALRARLAIEDPMVAPTGGSLFDSPLAEAVSKAQKRYGLDPDGVVHGATLAALNVPVSDRIDQIIANMERWRWLPSSLPADRIQVNIAAAILTLFRNDAPLLSMKAVTGRPDDMTPMLRSMIVSIVFNPPWNVPASIAAKELWPKERAHPGYLQRNDFRVITADDGNVRLQQRAGPKAALGHVKFDFANPYGVYLHDTPTHGTFTRYTRQDSHGCVRLERPVVLAKALLESDPRWTPEMIDQTIALGDSTVRTSIPTPIAVYLLYWTAFVGADGIANFRPDPYGWDALLLQRIAAAARRDA